MAKSLAQIQKQIAKLEAQADAVKKKEAAGVILRIKDAIAHYGLTAADLGLTGRSGVRGKAAAVKKTARKAKASKVKYHDDAGNTWSGHGRRPKWYLDAIAAGKTPEQLAA